MRKNEMYRVKQIIGLYMLIIATGVFLLQLPFAQKEAVQFIDSVFVAVSALSVTGLTPLITVESWTVFGQFILLLLIQIGGIGLSATIIILLEFLNIKETFQNRLLLVEDSNYDSFHKIRDKLKKMIIITFIIEFFGAIVLVCIFAKQYPIEEAIWYGVFHSISSYCNAGFDLLGDSSLINYQSNLYLLLIISFLIVIGGLGYPVLENVNAWFWGKIKKIRIKIKLHTKIVLLMTVLLVLTGCIFFLVAENNQYFNGMSYPEKIVNALFLSITPRTAGYANVHYDDLSQFSQFLTVILMFIGGAPVSTAGGVKVTTVFILILVCYKYFKGHKNMKVFHRSIPDSALEKAFAVFMVYMILVLASSLLLMLTEVQDLMSILFEVISALSTVGLSMNMTAELTVVGKVIIIALMFIGRIGTLLIGILLVGGEKKEASIKYPTGKVIIG